MINIILSFIFVALIILHLSWIVLLLYPKKEKIEKENFPPLSILIPAHNEQKFIANTINKVLQAPYPQQREVIVVNDGSDDNTEEIVKQIQSRDNRVKLYYTDHQGKANALNLGVKKAKHEILLALDADSEIKKDALMQIVQPFAKDDVGAVSGIIRAKYVKNPLTWFQDFEYILSSGWRFICNKISGTYILPGFLAFKKEAWSKVGGFSSDTLSEDFDVGLRLKKAGYNLVMSQATIYTRVPETIKGLIKQRARWGRGTIQVIRKHHQMLLNKEYMPVGFYGLPTQLYWYFHGLVYVPIVLYQVLGGYFRNFFVHQNYLSLEVGKYFFSWFSAYGMADYAYTTFLNNNINVVFLLLLGMFLLYLIYDFLLLIKISQPRLRHLLVIFFFFPYALFSVSLQAFPFLYEIYKPGKSNKWEKSY